MSHLKKILGINLLILLAYTLLIHATASKGGGEEGLDILFESMFAVGLQVVINFIVSMIYFWNKNSPLGKAFLLSTGLVLVIGFSTCWGSAFI